MPCMCSADMWLSPREFIKSLQLVVVSKLHVFISII